MFTFPVPTDLIDSITTWSAPFFSSWLPIAYFTIGVTVASLLIVFLANVVIAGVQYLVGRYHGSSSGDSIHPKYKIKSINMLPQSPDGGYDVYS